MQRKNLRKLITLFSLLLITLSASAQTIRLNGRVLNQKNEPVAGASISVSEINRSFAADIEGRFVISLEAGKKYTFTVTAVGYQTKAVDEVEVKTTEIDNTITILLNVAAKEGTEIVIRSTARRENTSGLLSFQRNNTSLSSGLSADFIRRTPDKNTGEVLKRVSGASIQDNKFVIVRGLSDRYNQALINGAQLPSSEPDKKAFSFDVIPSQLIDNIIINKTATPDLTGEFAGGLVQIQTKDVPTKNILTLGVNFGYNTQSTFKDFITNQRETGDWFGFDNGRRDVPEGFYDRNQYQKLSSSSQAEQSKLFRSDVFNEKKITAAPIQSYNLTFGKGYKLKNGSSVGFITGLTYRNAQNLYSVNRNINRFDGTVERSLTDDQNRFSTSVGAVANVAFTTRKLKIAFKNLYNQLYDDNYYIRKGETIDGQEISFRSSYLNQRSLLSSQLEAEQQLSKSGIKLKLNGNFSYNLKSQPDLRTASYQQSIGSSIPLMLVEDETGRFFSNLKDFSYGGGGALTLPFTLANEKQTFKAGGGTLIRIRDFKSRNFRYRLDDNTNNSLLSLPFNEVFDQQYIGDGKFVYSDETQNEDKYFGVSIINNGFAMFDNKFSDKLRLVWGLRVENFQQFLTTVGRDLKRVIVNTNKWDYLPSVNLSYSLKEKHQIRLAGYRTVARPEFREIAPFSFYDFEQNYAMSGDTSLRRSDIWNADIRYEWYPKASEGISVAVFYKKFKDPIELRALAAGSVRRYQFQNAAEANTYGVEFEARKGLGFIAPKLDVFNIFTNVTVLSSSVKLTGVTAGGQAQSFNRPLQGQSPYLVNVGLQYNSKSGKYNASLLYNKIGQRLSLAGGKDQQIFDIYERPRDLVDLQIAMKVLKNKGEFKFTASDIFNQPFYFYDNIDASTKFTRGTDRLWNSYTPGTTFTLGFTYDFIK